MSYWEQSGITLEAQLVWPLSISQAVQWEHNWCLPCTWFLARKVCGVACLLSITKEEKSDSWPDLLASSSTSTQLLFPMCVCVYTRETWTQIKTKAETNHSVILSTVIPIRLSKLTDNYVYIFCSIWDNFISKPFLLLSVLAVQSWKWSEERTYFLTWILLADDVIRLLSAQKIMHQFSKRESWTLPNSDARNWVCMVRVCHGGEGGTRGSAHNSTHGDCKSWQVIVVLGELMVSLEGKQQNLLRLPQAQTSDYPAHLFGKLLMGEHELLVGKQIRLGKMGSQVPRNLKD